MFPGCTEITMQKIMLHNPFVESVFCDVSFFLGEKVLGRTCFFLNMFRRS